MIYICRSHVVRSKDVVVKRDFKLFLIQFRPRITSMDILFEIQQ
jgi:hypothetical protein